MRDAIRKAYSVSLSLDLLITLISAYIEHDLETMNIVEQPLVLSICLLICIFVGDKE